MAAIETVLAQQATAFIMRNHDLITGRVLDVGCGNKPYKALFPDLEWVGADERPVGDVQADMTDLGDIGEFDTVLCIDALNLTPYPHKAVAEMVRVCKQGGHILICARTTTPDDTGYFGIHTAALVGMLIEAGAKPLTDSEARNVSLTGLFSRAEADNFWTNLTWLEGVGNQDLERFTAYLDRRYPLLTCVAAVKE